MNKTKSVVKKQTKKTFEYTAVMAKEEDGKYTVNFPSLPGCFTYGNNLKHAQKMAKEVLELWLMELQDKGEKIPIQKQKPFLVNFKVLVEIKKGKISYTVTNSPGLRLHS